MKKILSHKRLLLGLAPVVAVAALAVAPAMAQSRTAHAAPAAVAQGGPAHWTIDGNRIPDGKANGVTVTSNGSLSITGDGLTVTCSNITNQELIWNDPTDPDGMGTSAYNEVDDIDFGAPCAADGPTIGVLPTCQVTPVVPNNLPWKTYAFDDNSVEFVGVDFTDTFANTTDCGPFAGVSIEVTEPDSTGANLVGVFDQADQQLTFTNAPGLTVPALGADVLVNGTVMLSPTTGTEIDLESGS